MNLRRGVGFASLLLTLCLLSGPIGRADDGAAQAPPPEIQAILQKMQSGQMPSPEDLQKLQQWQAGMQSLPQQMGPQGSQGASPELHLGEGIPARIHVTFKVDSKVAPDSSSTCQMEATGDAVLFADIQGDGDWYDKLRDPSAKASSFKFEPVMSAPGQIVFNGSGSGRRHDEHNDHCWEHWDVTGSQPGLAGLLLHSSGHDLLYGDGGAGVQLTGTYTAGPTDCTDEKPVERPFSSGSLCDIDGAAESFSVPFEEEYHEKENAADSAGHPKPAMTLSYKALVAAIQSGKPAKVSGSESFDFRRGDNRSTGTATIEITLRPTKEELVVEPADEKTYEGWIPTPDADDVHASELFGHPQPIELHLALHDDRKGGPATSPGPTKGDADQPGIIDVYLKDVSKNHGIAMNYPPQSEADDKPDLFFLAKQPDGVTYLAPDHVRTTTAVTEARVRVAARDTGAYGKVQAEVESLGLESTDPRTKKAYLVLPMDDDDNKIADAWEDRDPFLRGRHLPPDWDGEEDPTGMATRGNGLTLYEEYRGFVLSDGGSGEVFQRWVPKKKAVFVHPNGRDRDLYRKGLALYQQATGIVALEVARGDRLGIAGDGADVPHWLNFNRTDYSPVHVYAIWIDDQDKDWDSATAKKHRGGVDARGIDTGRFGDGTVDTGFTISTLRDEATWHGQRTPKTTMRINVSRAAADRSIAGWATQFDDPSVAQAAAPLGIVVGALKASVADPVYRKGLVDEMIVETTMHEMGHATGAVHHAPEASGDSHCPMRYFVGDTHDALLFASKRWDLTTAPDGAPWRFCSRDWSEMTLKP